MSFKKIPVAVGYTSDGVEKGEKGSGDHRRFFQLCKGNRKESTTDDGKQELKRDDWLWKEEGGRNHPEFSMSKYALP